MRQARLDLVVIGLPGEERDLAKMLCREDPQRQPVWVVGVKHEPLRPSGDFVVHGAATLPVRLVVADQRVGYRIGEHQWVGELARDYPQRPEPQFYLGNCYKALKQFDKAEGSYRRAIELKPDEAQYYTFLADTLREQKSDNTKEVIALLGKALALDATDTNAQLGLALCYESEGNLKKAESLLEEAVSREPALRRAHVLLAKVYGREGKTQLAAQEGAVIGRLDTAEQERRSKAMGTSANQSR